MGRRVEDAAEVTVEEDGMEGAEELMAELDRGTEEESNELDTEELLRMEEIDDVTDEVTGDEDDDED